MGFKDEYDFSGLTNEAERLVIEELEKQLHNEEMCKCQDCVLDIVALALNNTRPAYRISLMGSIYARAMDGTKYAAEVKKAVAKAVRKVKDNPSHDTRS